MKVQGGRADTFCTTPPQDLRGALIYGEDASQVALRRRALCDAMLGADGEAELRLETVEAGRLRTSPGELGDMLRATGFFPGRRVIWVRDASDAVAETVATALGDAATPDAVVIVSAGALPARSRLRAAFEAASDAAAIACYGDPPDRIALRAKLETLRIRATPEALEAVAVVAATMDAGTLERFLEILSLYKLDDSEALGVVDVAACAPNESGGDIDQAATAVTRRRPGDVRAAMARLSAQGVASAAILLAVARRFHLLHQVISANEPAQSALGRMRPPFFGARRDAMLSDARDWSRDAVEQALARLHEVEAALRSGERAPPDALVERALLRIAMTPP